MYRLNKNLLFLRSERDDLSMSMKLLGTANDKKNEKLKAGIYPCLSESLFEYSTE